MKTTLASVVFFPKIHIYSLVMRTPDKFQYGSFYKISDQYFSKLSRSSNQGKFEKFSQPRRVRGGMATKCYMVSWGDPGTEKEYEVI